MVKCAESNNEKFFSGGRSKKSIQDAVHAVSSQPLACVNWRGAFGFVELLNLTIKTEKNSFQVGIGTLAVLQTARLMLACMRISKGVP